MLQLQVFGESNGGGIGASGGRRRIGFDFGWSLDLAVVLGQKKTGQPLVEKVGIRECQTTTDARSVARGRLYRVETVGRRGRAGRRGRERG